MKGIRVHASCVALAGVGVLLRGPSRAGKSDLALRLLVQGGRLVADDGTDLVVREGRLYAAAPPAIAGLIEVRGVGIVNIGCISEAEVLLVVDLVAPDEVERMPEEQWCEVVANVRVRRVALTAFEASAVPKVMVAAQVAGGRLGLVS